MGDSPKACVTLEEAKKPTTTEHNVLFVSELNRKKERQPAGRRLASLELPERGRRKSTFETLILS